MKVSLCLILTIVSLYSFGQNQLEIGLNNGQTLYPESLTYKDKLFKKPYLLINEEEQIELSRVSYYQTARDYYKIASIRSGLQFFDNARLRRIANGALVAYEHEYLVTTTTGAGMNSIPMTTTSTVIDYYHFENGRFEKINDRLLTELVQDDPKSRKTLETKKNQKFVNAGIYAVGGVVILAGIVNMASSYSDDNTNTNMEDTSMSIPPAVIIGAAIMWVPWIIRQARADKLSTPAIIADYNSRH